MADLVTRLLLNDSQFNSNIERSKKQVQSFENVSQKFGSGIKTGLTLATGAIGLGIGAVELFDKTIQSSQTTADAWDVKIGGLKATVDEFFSALSTGDFSAFIGGLSDIIDRAELAIAAFDQLGNTTISFDFFSTERDADIAKYRQIALDKSLPMNERNKALKNWEEVLALKVQEMQVYQDDTLDALKKKMVVGTKLNADYVSLDDFAEVLHYDIIPPVQRDKIKEIREKEYEEYTTKLNELEEKRWNIIDVEGVASKAPASKEIREQAKKDQEELAKAYKQAILFNQWLVKETDESLSNTKDVAKSINVLERLKYTDKQTFSRARDRVTNENKRGGETANENTVKDYELKLAELRKELNNTKDLAIAGKLTNEINALEAEVERIKKIVKQTAFRQKYGERDFGVSKNEIQGTTKGFTADLSKIKLPKLDLPIQNKDIDLVDQYSDRLYAMSTLMGSVNSIVDQGADSWLSYGAGVVQAIGMAIPQIMALTAVKKTEATANTAAAATGAASSVASIPFVGPVLAIAAVASIIAALANIPKFAGGGIIGGGSFVGDRLPIMANSGEMILNTRQQSNLFQMLNSSPRPSTSVSFDNPKVRGEDIYLSLKNYTKSTGKKL